MTLAEDTKRIGKKKQLRLMTFLIALLTAAVLFAPAIFNGKGYFIFYGDFNVQQIPFYQHCHDMVRSGSFGWDWITDLGTQFIGSYSFYLLGSPFFWLTIPFPNWMLPYLMGPLLILKFACAALTAYMFIRRFTSRAETAMIGGLLYAFSGFSVYNVFFNHFHEAIIVFPLLMLGMEVFWAEKRRGALLLAVFASALTNYYFFFGMVIFTIIYWFIRIFSKSFKFSFSQFFLMLFECVVGLLLAAAVLLPSILMVMQNNRLGSIMTGWSFVLYGKEQIFLNVIECFFFPPDLPARPVFFPGAEVKWSSLGGWLPLFGMVGTVTALLSNKKGTWLRRLLVTCAFFALVPGLNSVFSLLNTSYYARWFYMPILMMSLATAIAIEDTDANWNTSWKWCTAITVGLTLVIGFLPKGMADGEFTGYGLYTNAATNPIKYLYQSIRYGFGDSRVEGDYYDLRFWVTAAIAILSIFAVKGLIPLIKERATTVLKPIVAIICIVSVLYSTFFLISGQEHSYDIEGVMIDTMIEGEVDLDIADDEFARIDVYDGVDNTGLYLGYPSINFFHSVVSSSITDYYEFIGVQRSVASRADIEKHYASASLLSVKYLLDPKIKNSKEFLNDHDETVAPYYTFVDEQNDCNIYINDCYIPMGFTYDLYMTDEQAEKYTDTRRSQILLKALLIEEDDIDDFKPYMKDIETKYNVLETDPSKNSPRFTYTDYANDCAARRANSADSFVTNKNGFESTITLEKSNYVFFSVPYVDGWTAYVNGAPAEIKRVNKGFMAVLAHEGENTITFEYETPGLFWGINITIGAAAVTVIYLITVLIIRKFRPVTEVEYPEGDVIAARTTLFEASVSLNESEFDLLDSIDNGYINAYPGFEGGFNIDDSALSEVGKYSLSEDTAPLTATQTEQQETVQPTGSEATAEPTANTEEVSAAAPAAEEQSEEAFFEDGLTDNIPEPPLAPPVLSEQTKEEDKGE